VSEKSSFGESLRAAAIIGGGEGITYVIGMVRTKVVALLLGPSGVGLIALYLAYMGLLQTISGLGIASSGVREVAEANSTNDPEKIAARVKTLRRACWLTGMLGLCLAVAVAAPASRWLGSAESSTFEFALLGFAVLLQAVLGGQLSLLQGTRRLADLTRIKVYGVCATTVLAIVAYSFFGRNAIVPVLIASVLVQLALSWFFSRRVSLVRVTQTWRQTAADSQQLIGLGFSFMWSALLGAGTTSLLGFLVVRELGVEANGMYSAAWMLSGLFAGFILGAMGTDFYPRLTAVQSNHGKVNRLVNEQTEIAILLALPGLLGTLAFAPLLIQLFYSAKFLPAAQLLPWFVVGVFGQVVTWPLGYILIAKGAKKLYALTETLNHGIRFLASVSLLNFIGLKGLALAVPLSYVFCAAIMLPIVNRLVGFAWNGTSVRLLLVSLFFVAAGFAANRLLEPSYGFIVGSLLTAATALISARGLSRRLGEGHKLVKMLLTLPGGRLVAGLGWEARS
jgi:antigen flippase